MDQNTARVLVDGVRDIAVASLNKTPINPNDLGSFLSGIGTSLVNCLKDADAFMESEARSDTEPPTATDRPVAETTAPAAPAAAASETPAQAPAPAEPPTAEAPVAAAQAAVAEAPVQEAPARKKTAAKKADARKASAAAPAAVAETTASAPAPAAEAPKKKRKGGYKFAHINREPVVPIKESIGDDFITCLIDGEKRKMLHRHLRSKYDMSEAEYRKHFKLPADYPMTAPGYSKEKRLVALDQGLGKKEQQPASETPEPAKVTKRQRSKAPADAEA